MKLKLGLAVAAMFLSVGAVHADINLSPMPKNADGSIRTIDQYTAIQYCANRKMRLPTAREWAIHSQSLGAKGIRETRYANVSRRDQRVVAERSRMRGEGYYTIYRLNSAKQIVVDFYFNETGYRRPTGPQGDYFFWSSSADPYHPYDSYGFYGDSGFIGFGSRSFGYYEAVRCAVERR